MMGKKGGGGEGVRRGEAKQTEWKGEERGVEGKMVFSLLMIAVILFWAIITIIIILTFSTNNNNNNII